jgi:hypothetical protein
MRHPNAHYFVPLGNKEWFVTSHLLCQLHATMLAVRDIEILGCSGKTRDALMVASC